MRHSASLVALSVFIVASCSTAPTAPTPAATEAAPVLIGGEGTSSASTVTTDRIRLQRVGGADIVANLVTGQVIAVPLNVNVQIWAEVRLDEGDFVRLVVDWGNGNSDFFPCGACRVENKYTREGTYTVVAKIVDQNAPSGTAPLRTVTVTLNVLDFNPPPIPLTCAGVTANFDVIVPFPLALPGVNVSASGAIFIGGATPPSFTLFQGRAIGGSSTNPVFTFAFDTDKNFMTISIGNGTGIIATTVPALFTFQAFDAAGNLVASGTKMPTIPSLLPIHGYFEETLTISGPPFRRVVLFSAAPSGFVFYDNLVAGCIP